MAERLRVLFLHGNGGGAARFARFRALYEARRPAWQAHFPALPGFDGRPLVDAAPGWETFLEPIREEVAAHPSSRWVLYGHGIGGSLLLEWARRGFDLPDDRRLAPAFVLLHGCIGAALDRRLFPRFMRPWGMRLALQAAIGWQPLQGFFERKLFIDAKAIPQDLRDRFFEGYRNCAAFPHFFDLITPAWYRGIQETLDGSGMRFLWGARERVVAADHLSLWKADFPRAEFVVIPDWDHFPMLDSPVAYFETLRQFMESAHA